MLGGLFGSKPVDPTKVTASATEKSHGPFTLQVLVDETVVEGKRAVKPTLFLQTSKGDAEGSSIEELMNNIKLVYDKRLKEKNAANVTARNRAVAANTAAKKAKANAEAASVKAAANAKAASIKASANALKAKVEKEAAIAKKQADKAHMNEVIAYLKGQGFKYKTGLLATVIDPSDQAKYDELKSYELLKQQSSEVSKNKSQPVLQQEGPYSSLNSSSLKSNLPVGWSEKTSKTTGKPYYVSSNGKTQWNKPVASPAAPAAPAVGGKRRTRNQRKNRRNKTNRH